MNPWVNGFNYPFYALLAIPILTHYSHGLLGVGRLSRKTNHGGLNEKCLWNAWSRFESLWPNLISSSLSLPPACGQAFDLPASCSSCLLPCCPCHHGTISQNNVFYKLLLVMVFYKPLKYPSLVNHTNFPLVIWVCFMCGFFLHFLWSSLSMTSSVSPSSHTFSEWHG